MKNKLVVVAIAALLLTAVTLASQSPATQTATPKPEAKQPPGVSQPAGEQPAVTFRAEVNYVEVDARVVDEQGRFVSTLTQNDFQVFEEGRPQQISVFTLVNLPV